jgi:diguanylate cyclase (GGDEF)-like protein
MLHMYQILLSNLAIIFIAIFCMFFISKKLKRLPKFYQYALHIFLYGSVIILLLYNPIRIGDFRFDLRVVILLFLAITYGWRITIPVLMITASWRYMIIGGSVALESVIYNMTVPVLIGLFFYQNQGKVFQFKKLFLLSSSIWLITLLPVTWVTPNGLEILKSIAIVHYLTFTICFLILYGLYVGMIKYEEGVEKVHHLAFHDALTGLPNRYKLMEYLQNSIERCKRNNKELAVIFLDLDRFKFINDSKGHFTGDLILKQVAERLVKNVREEDIVARHGGDEFIVLMEVVQQTQVEEVVKRIHESFTQPFLLDSGEEFFTSPSIGISLLSKDGEDSETLLINADIAMYRAKKRGKNTYQFFVHQQDNNQERKIKLEHGLMKALDKKEFLLHFQPQIKLDTAECKGFEALLRWNHSEYGLVSPMEFIPIAEETRLIVPIGQWVIETACRQIKTWQDKGLPAYKVAVNVSVLQLQESNFVEMIKRILHECKISPQFLELEITESFMQDAKESFTILSQLKEIGVKLSIDDFGTGYSSLHILNQLPIDYVKIDQSFIKEMSISPKTASLVKVMIDMGSKLEFEMIAEGIENEWQAKFLNQNGCRFGQGYLFCRPLPADEIEGWIKKQAY